MKLPGLVSALVQRGALVRCVLTPSAARLVSAVALARTSVHDASAQFESGALALFIVDVRDSLGRETRKGT